ncbi:hypothetical protein As57867_024958, partial [Aphanomyces stellatus]
MFDLNQPRRRWFPVIVLAVIATCVVVQLKFWSVDMPLLLRVQDRAPLDPNAPFLRASVVYFPIDKVDEAEDQLRWSHRAWSMMLASQPPSWRTDFVIFSEADLDIFNELNCTRALRETAADASKCIVVHYTTVRTADFGYAGADPINVVAMDSPATALYDYLLRTDIDTMVTPAFATWRPSQLTTGIDGA